MKCFLLTWFVLLRKWLHASQIQNTKISDFTETEFIVLLEFQLMETSENSSVPVIHFVSRLEKNENKLKSHTKQNTK